jgi:hypothetical protein
MLKNFFATSVAETEVSIIPSQTNELLVLSLYFNGGENGGDFKVIYPNGFSASFTIAAEDTIVLDSQVAVPAGSSISFIGSDSGITAMASATLSLADV